jgi:hypothetical protein
VVLEIPEPPADLEILEALVGLDHPAALVALEDKVVGRAEGTVQGTRVGMDKDNGVVDTTYYCIFRI